MTLGIEEMETVIEKISRKLTEELMLANRLGNLDKVLDKYGVLEEKKENISLEEYDSKIIVIGSVTTNTKDITKILRTLGIDKSRVEFYSDYTKLKHTDFSFLRNNEHYSDILVCAMPHKMIGTEGYSSFVAMVEDNPNEYPALIKIGKMKYTNSAFKKALLKTNFYNNMNKLK